MIVAISSGHNPDGKVACGVVSKLKESTENRYVVKKLIKRNENKKKLDIVYDCTINNASGQADHLKRCSEEHLSHKDADLHIQIHFNSFNKKASGSEVLVKKETKLLKNVGTEILYELSNLGFVSRGVKEVGNLYMLNHVPNFMILEVCFADNENDAHLYNSDKKAVVKAIYKGIWKGLEASLPPSKDGRNKVSNKGLQHAKG